MFGMYDINVKGNSLVMCSWAHCNEKGFMSGNEQEKQQAK
jgi:hypothetical protein